MKAAVFEATKKPLVVKDLPDPECAPNGAIITVHANGVCRSDWHAWSGDWSWIGDNASLYSLGEIEIGDNVVISQNSYLCTGSHDLKKPSFDIYAEKIVVEAESWIAADVFVAPGVRIGHGAVVGARSTVLHDLPSMMVCYGNPARPVRPRLDGDLCGPRT